MIKLTPRLEERINARWLIWHPWMIMAVRKRLQNGTLTDHMAALSEARDLHRTRYVQALAQGIREQVIRRRGLDDPRIPDEQFRADIENILRYKKAQLGNHNGLYSRRKHVTDAV